MPVHCLAESRNGDRPLADVAKPTNRREPDMRAARLLVPITTFGALIATMGTSGYQPPTTVQVLWQFEAGG